MSGNRVELIVSFWVGSENGREDAERIIGRLEGIARHDGFHGVSEFEVRPWTVNGNDWDAKWPPKPAYCYPAVGYHTCDRGDGDE